MPPCLTCSAEWCHLVPPLPPLERCLMHPQSKCTGWKIKIREWEQRRQKGSENGVNDGTGRKGSSVPQGIWIKALSSALCRARGEEVWAVIKSRQRQSTLSEEHWSLSKRGLSSPWLQSPIMTSAYCLCVKCEWVHADSQVLLWKQLLLGLFIPVNFSTVGSQSGSDSVSEICWCCTCLQTTDIRWMEGCHEYHV